MGAELEQHTARTCIHMSKVNTFATGVHPTTGFVDGNWSGDQAHDTVGECFRHRGTSMTVWLDGHVTEIKQTTGEDIPPKWYTGE